MSKLWIDIEPGDIGFDKGIGISGWLIRTGTQSAHGHCWVYHRRIDQNTWETVEAGPRGGLIRRVRTVQPNKVARIWRTEQERQAILIQSNKLVGAKYGWGEIFRIAFRILGVKLPKHKDNPNRVICSNHAAQSVLAARPALKPLFEYAPYEIWPGELAVTLSSIEWTQDRIADRMLSRVPV